MNLVVLVGFSFPQLLSQDVRPHLSYLPALQVDRVLHALKTAYHAHLGQHRRSGEPFVIHPVEVMKILADYRVDADTLVAGLLHVRQLPLPRDGTLWFPVMTLRGLGRIGPCSWWYCTRMG